MMLRTCLMWWMPRSERKWGICWRPRIKREDSLEAGEEVAVVQDLPLSEDDKPPWRPLQPMIIAAAVQRQSLAKEVQAVVGPIWR